MTEEEENDYHLQQHLELVKRMYLRMLEENSWPWEVNPDRWNRDHQDFECICGDAKGSRVPK